MRPALVEDSRLNRSTLLAGATAAWHAGLRDPPPTPRYGCLVPRILSPRRDPHTLTKNDLLRRIDGVAFTHEFTATEASANVLSLDDDLAPWALFATDGLPLANAGEVRAENMLDLPPGSGSDLPAAHLRRP